MKLAIDELQDEISQYDWSFPVDWQKIHWCEIEHRCASKLISILREESSAQQNECDGLAQYLARDCIHCQCAKAKTDSLGDLRSWWVLDGMDVRTFDLRVKFRNDADVVYSSPNKIEAQMYRLRELVASPVLNPPVVSAWLAYLIFVRTHPFQDGNGRAARALFCHSLNKWTQSDEFIHPIGPYMRLHRHEFLSQMNFIQSSADLGKALNALHVNWINSVKFMASDG